MAWQMSFNMYKFSPAYTIRTVELSGLLERQSFGSSGYISGRCGSPIPHMMAHFGLLYRLCIDPSPLQIHIMLDQALHQLLGYVL